MRRRAPCPVLVLLAAAMAQEVPAQTPRVVGQFADFVPTVQRALPTEAFQAVRQKLSPVLLGMKVATNRTGRADIALQRVRDGKLILGPRTAVEFDEGIAGGRPVLTLRQRIGLLRLVMMPRGKRPGAGEYRIQTEAGEVRLLGTDVYVRTDRWGMVVAVVEGRVEVVSASGRKVDVEAGEWTYVAVGEPPTPPGPFERDPGGPAPGSPGDAIVVDPPGLTRVRLDLPR